MKKSMLLGCFFGVMMFVAQSVMATTFPSADNNTVVTGGNDGVITVKAAGESGWVLVQYYQDNMRAGAGNNQIIRPSQDAGGTMVFQLEKTGMNSGQVAFNFRNSKLSGNPWLAIPDCRVKPAGSLGMGMSYYTSDIPESGGAMFVYTGSGVAIQYPIDQSACGGGSQASVTTKGSSRASESGGMTQSVVKSPDSQNVQTKHNIVHHIGNNNKISQKSAIVTQKGATVNINGKCPVGTVKKGVVQKDGAGQKDACVSIDARTYNISKISFGKDKETQSDPGATVESECVNTVDGKMSKNCADVSIKN